MKINIEKYIGKSPILYAEKILKECAIKSPPVCEKTIADALRLPIFEFNQSDIDQFTQNNAERASQLKKRLSHACAWLSTSAKGESHIRLFGDMILERKRSGVFHEIIHYTLPWHTELDYIDPLTKIDSIKRNFIEKEAYTGGSSLAMPLDFFIKDILSSDISIQTIFNLKKRYITSLEATSIWYAYINPRPCAIMMVEPFSNETNTFLCPHKIDHQYDFHFEMPLRFKPNNEPHYPLQVKYFVASKSFRKFLPKGRGINENNVIYTSWCAKKIMRDELHSSSFSSRTPYRFHAECYPFKKTDDVLVLLWLEDKQFQLSLN